MNPIEKYRQENKLTCEELGLKVGRSKATISRHCRGFQIDGDTAILYQSKLGIPVEKLRPDLCCHSQAVYEQSETISD